VEFLHNATLLHDDVIDEATTRRHQPSSNAVYGDKASILGGDYLFSRGFETMVKTGRIDVLTVLSKASRIIIEGELLQLMHSGSFDLTLETYFQITQAKTAVLFSAACEVGALSANASSNDVQALAQFGEHLGMAFQMIDDILDYEGEEGVLGKSIGNDLMEGKVTLPLLLCHKDLNDHDKEHFEAAFLKKDLEKCLFYLNQTKAFYKSRILAQRHCEHAHNILMPYQSSPAAQRLQNLCAISLKRAA
jgi:octaprenyl-diphosphate synthase